MNYNVNIVEKKWQDIWQKEKIFKTKSKILKTEPKYYILDMFPYPSGSGLHVGHVESYAATDVLARLKKMQGFNVMHPIGWDAFGLPTERAAIRKKIHPSIITKYNIENFRKQIKNLGLNYDWSREINTSDPYYYKWTQWIFRKLYKKGLVYISETPVNWCNKLKTVLANEEVKNGTYIETGDAVEYRLMRQWMLKITAYSEYLLKDLDELDWSFGIKEMQKKWIGKQVGLKYQFKIDRINQSMSIYMEQPENIYNVEYCSISKKHNVFKDYLNKRDDVNFDEKNRYLSEVKIKHPFTNKKLNIYIDKSFSSEYGEESKLDSSIILEKKKYKLSKSSFFDGYYNNEMRSILFYLTCKNKIGERSYLYKIRDWLFARQRYWGEPFPIINYKKNISLLSSNSDLPISLPMIENYVPDEKGKSPLNKANKKWSKVLFLDREIDTMPQWAGSCWYYLRYLDPWNRKEICSKKLEKYWMPVDLYIGGIEHSVLHLLYARFWHKVLFDSSIISTKEPFMKLFNQGIIFAESYKDSNGKYYHKDEVILIKDKFYLKDKTKKLEAKIEKMSKSKLNVINPDDVVKEYGTDAIKIYELFLGPLDQPKPWRISGGMSGIFRFLQKSFNTILNRLENISKVKLSENFLYKLDQTVKKVDEQTILLKFNTAISQIMILLKEIEKEKVLDKRIILSYIKIVYPYAPHLGEELWSLMGNKELLIGQNWLTFQNTKEENKKIKYVIQINGKKKLECIFLEDKNEDFIKSYVLNQDKIKTRLMNKTVKKIIIVKKKIVNIVIS